MRRKNRVILLTLALTALLFAGCNSVEQENESQIFESEEIQSEEMQSTVEESSGEEVSEETDNLDIVDEETTEGYDLNIISVESEIMRKFLEGEGEAVFSERFISICSEWDLENCYEGTIDEIVMGYYENSVQFINNQKLSDLVVNAKEIFFRDNEVFIYICIEGELNLGRSQFMILKETDEGIKICFQTEQGEREDYSFKDNGIILGFANAITKHTVNYYYLDENGEIYELYMWAGFCFKAEDEATQQLDMEELLSKENVYIGEYFLNGNEYYTIDFSDEVKEAEREKIRKHIIDGGYIEDMVYITEEEIQQKIETYVSSIGINPVVLYE